jgi:hypothetical protein
MPEQRLSGCNLGIGTYCLERGAIATRSGDMPIDREVSADYASWGSLRQLLILPHVLFLLRFRLSFLC